LPFDEVVGHAVHRIETWCYIFSPIPPNLSLMGFKVI
jgi:hypothetical protein